MRELECVLYILWQNKFVEGKYSHQTLKEADQWERHQIFNCLSSFIYFMTVIGYF